jgi:hypothetical protein
MGVESLPFAQCMCLYHGTFETSHDVRFLIATGGNNFKTHQEKMAREREAYYLQVKARMMKDAAFGRSEESPST